MACNKNVQELATDIATKANASVTITAGNGLTGGGDLSANRTLAVGAGSGIAVAADAVSVDINGLTAEATIDQAADYVMVYDASAGALRKALIGNTVYTSGSFTATATGLTTSEQGTVTYRRIGPVVHLHFPTISGTSNAITFTLTGLPESLTPATTQTFIMRLRDNGTWLSGLGDIASTTITFYPNFSKSQNWTSSGTKSCGNCTISYIVA